MRIDPDGMLDDEWNLNIQTGKFEWVSNLGGNEVQFVNLVNSDGHQLWQLNFDGNVNNLFAIAEGETKGSNRTFLQTYGLILAAAGNRGDKLLTSGQYKQLNGKSGNFNERPFNKLSQWGKVNKTFAENLSKAGKLGNGLVAATALVDVFDDGHVKSSTVVNVALTTLAITVPITAPFVLTYGIIDYVLGMSEKIDANYSGIETGIYGR